jgi:hypothetical protein
MQYTDEIQTGINVSNIDLNWFDLWCSTPLLAIFQQYHDAQFYLVYVMAEYIAKGDNRFHNLTTDHAFLKVFVNYY